MSKREIVLDTETTGLDPRDGHRIIEIACVELVNYIPTGNHFHVYINPERDVPEEAYRVHGISTKFLHDKPVFADIAKDFIDFIKGDPLVIHNAPFDMKFLKAELNHHRFNPFGFDQVIDTLAIARQKFPGAANNLDALCKRFSIDLSGRTLHGALLDANLLAQVYLELVGGQQPKFDLAAQKRSSSSQQEQQITTTERQQRPARQFTLSTEEAEAHQAMLKHLKNPLWAK